MKPEFLVRKRGLIVTLLLLLAVSVASTTAVGRAV